MSVPNPIAATTASDVTPDTAPGVATDVEPVSRSSTQAVHRPLLGMRWQQLAYLHWALDPAVVAARLPRGLEPDRFDGRSYVGLVPFVMAGIGLGGGGVPLPFGRFPETNVRTYVVGPDGGRGVYFHSLDITRLAPTLVAQLGYRLPYAWSGMHVARRGSRVGYLARRRWPGPGGTTSRVVVEVGDPLGGATTALDDFLTARWSLYTATPSGSILRARVDHAPWQLRSARLVTLEDGLLAAGGYDVAGHEPVHVRYSDGVAVRVGPPRRVG